MVDFGNHQPIWASRLMTVSIDATGTLAAYFAPTLSDLHAHYPNVARAALVALLAPDRNDPDED